jgi:succinate-semialdehyde dehydrogenase/glutarate-semialdehyde dehydrogenase
MFPGSGMKLQSIFDKAFENHGIFQTVLADIPEIAKIIAHPLIPGVSLTGSNKAGAAVAAQAGASIKKCLLELGGSDPFIVLEDADINKAIDHAFASRMINCGQTCISAKRFILHEKIADRFINGLKQKIETLVPGDPSDPATSIAIMARRDLAEQLQQQVDKSVEMGASILHAGGHRDKTSNYFHPMILSEVQQGMPAYEEELFGPVFTVFIVNSTKQAIDIANDSRYGLGASIWSEDLGKAECMGLELNVGAVAINDMVKSDPRLPFGGVGQSGFGRELGLEGIREFVNVKSIVLQP